jgi:hypothetical protein
MTSCRDDRQRRWTAWDRCQFHLGLRRATQGHEPLLVTPSFRGDGAAPGHRGTRRATPRRSFGSLARQCGRAPRLGPRVVHGSSSSGADGAILGGSGGRWKDFPACSSATQAMSVVMLIRRWILARHRSETTSFVTACDRGQERNDGPRATPCRLRPRHEVRVSLRWRLQVVWCASCARRYARRT